MVNKHSEGIRQISDKPEELKARHCFIRFHFDFAIIAAKATFPLVLLHEMYKLVNK